MVPAFDFRNPQHDAFGFEHDDKADNGTSTTTATTFQNKLTLTTVDVVAGHKYRMGWQAELYNQVDGQNAQIRVKIDGNNRALGTVTTSNSPNQGMPVSGHAHFVPTVTGPIDLTMGHRVEPGSTGTSDIKRARFEFWRVD